MSEQVWIGLAAALLVMLQVLSLWILNSTHKKISDVCAQNNKEHDDLWKYLKHHGHTCCDEKNPKVYIEGAG